ncbi:YggS family pyridoxal phosphate-dependent enzyme [bacterium]|nr:YggS family pyridoxal phosphate-dependent enzyme [bacterium]MBU1920052.1 YggS family pyridoxal phosphate-dependent enzyme [bacterium]
MDSSIRTDIDSRVQQVRDRIEATCIRLNRDPASIRIVAVTKTFPRELVRKACALSFTSIGENKIQEAIEKYEDGWLHESFPDVKLHMIGHLQTNKVRKAIPLFDSIDSVDSVKLAEKISQAALEAGKTLRILLEVNTSGEPQKFGLDESDVLTTVMNIKELPNLEVAGLMTVGPNVDDPERIRQSFVQLRSLFETIGAELNSEQWSTLSMGMSNDFEIAIAEGATEIRLGTILWGSRKA